MGLIDDETKAKEAKQPMQENVCSSPLAAVDIYQGIATFLNKGVAKLKSTCVGASGLMLHMG
jgi:hypothetical protein